MFVLYLLSYNIIFSVQLIPRVVFMYIQRSVDLGCCFYAMSEWHSADVAGQRLSEGGKLMSPTILWSSSSIVMVMTASTIPVMDVKRKNECVVSEQKKH